MTIDIIKLQSIIKQNLFINSLCLRINLENSDKY